ncbi:ArnT family glycosyltransferase [Candidatus Promineifilum breve]|uniref:ArnT family glycosyltransferase n=1 Tax=Candidatus Promineifilum breve TaxID=1806508 RepID=UPI00139022B7|nr:glycosyltransferase family 39 protein [Candidatus Promineifilum breve]
METNPNPPRAVSGERGRRVPLASSRVISTALLGGVLALALLLRVWLLGHDLPYMHHPDEPSYVAIGQTIFKTGDLNPHFFAYPSLTFYLNALAHAPYYALGRALGVFAARTDILLPTSLVMGTNYAPMPTAVLLSRGVTVAAGVGAVLLVYLIGRRLTGRRAVGLTAALLLALSPTHVYHSRIVTPDAFVTFFALLTLLMAVHVFQGGRTWAYVAAGIAVGLTASAKYNGALVAVVVPAAHFLRVGWAGWRDYRLYLAGVLSVLAFAATTPYALLDYPAFLEGMRFEAQHYATGHTGMEGAPAGWYASFLWATTGPLVVLALVQIGRGLLARSRPILLLSAFPLTYFLFITRFTVRNDRTILPLLPFLFLLAAWLLLDTWAATRKLSPNARRWAAVAWGLALLILVAWPARQVAAFVGDLHAPQVRAEAALWLADHAPAGARIALESYAPYVDPARYDVTAVHELIENPPQWYVDEGFDYLIASSGLYGRYFMAPQEHPDEVALYNALFDRFPLIQRFDSGRLEIRIYRVTP